MDVLFEILPYNSHIRVTRLKSHFWKLDSLQKNGFHGHTWLSKEINLQQLDMFYCLHALLLQWFKNGLGYNKRTVNYVVCAYFSTQAYKYL